MATLKTFCRIFYKIGGNPLPALRKQYNVPIVFGEDPDMLIFPEEKPGTKIFIFNSRGEIAVRDAQMFIGL